MHICPDFDFQNIFEQRKTCHFDILQTDLAGAELPMVNNSGSNHASPLDRKLRHSMKKHYTLVKSIHHKITNLISGALPLTSVSNPNLVPKSNPKLQSKEYSINFTGNSYVRLITHWISSYYSLDSFSNFRLI